MTIAAQADAPDVRVGLIGRGIGLSRTPAMHMAEAKAQGFTLEYRLFDMDEPEFADRSLTDVLKQAQDEGYAGVNVTYPYKIEVIQQLDELSANAAAVDAVNTVVFKGGRRAGHNTDLWGFAESFKQGLGATAGRHALLIGAGGAGVAVAHALADCGLTKISIHDVDLQRAASLADLVAKNRPGTETQAANDLAQLMAADRPDGVVNATPVGMAKLPGTSIPTELLDPSLWVADIVYFPLETALLKAARETGCRVLPGSGMAVFQAVRAFQLFTGRPADPLRMKATFAAFDTNLRTQADT